MFFVFIQLSSEEIRTLISEKLRSDTKGQPVVLLPHCNWIHCELSYLECSLCLYVFARAVSLQIRTSLCNMPRWRLFLSRRDSVIWGVGRAVSRCCPCLVQPSVWLGTLQRFIFVFCFCFFLSPFEMNSSNLSLLCTWLGGWGGTTARETHLI